MWWTLFLMYLPRCCISRCDSSPNSVLKYHLQSGYLSWLLCSEVSQGLIIIYTVFGTIGFPCESNSPTNWTDITYIEFPQFGKVLKIRLPLCIKRGNSQPHYRVAMKMKWTWCIKKWPMSLSSLMWHLMLAVFFTCCLLLSEDMK